MSLKSEKQKAFIIFIALIICSTQSTNFYNFATNKQIKMLMYKNKSSIYSLASPYKKEKYWLTFSFYSGYTQHYQSSYFATLPTDGLLKYTGESPLRFLH